jgi:replicative DNA helicase
MTYDPNKQSQFSTSERRSRLEHNMNNIGKIPPQDVGMEEGLLGAILNHSDLLLDIEESLVPEHFYSEVNKRVFRAILNLSADNSPIDILTVQAKLRELGELELVGGGYYITNLTQSTLKAGKSIEYHAKIITQKFIQRELIRNSTETIQAAYEDTTDVFDLLDRHDKGVFDLTSITQKKQADDISDLIDKAIDVINEPAVNGLTGVPSGFRDLDAVTGGWQKSDLVIIAARPAMGKTAFVMTCARNAAVDFKKPIVVFSLEMSSIQLTMRMVANETNIYMDRISKKQLLDTEKEQLKFKLKNLKESPIKIDDTASLNLLEFRAKCRRLKSQFDIQMIVVDYLQLMDGTDKHTKGVNRDGEIGKISRTLKSIAKELDVPVLALSQLSRTVESRPGVHGKRPIISDLRESGNIEQDADMVMFLYRPEYYGVTQDERGQSTAGLCELIIAKHRNGITTNVNVDFNGAYMRFKDWNSSVSFDFNSVKKPAKKTIKQVDIFTKVEEEDAPF